MPLMLNELRVLLDEAITYNDLDRARDIALEGFNTARDKEWVGEILYFKAQVEIIDGHYLEAIGYLDKAVRYNPNDGAAFNDLALCLIDLGKTDGVLALFDKGIKVEPGYATVYHNKGWFLNRLTRYEEALALFRKTLEIEPNRAVTYENIGDTLARLGRIKEARQAYQTAYNLVSPSYPEIKEQIREQMEKLEG